MNGVVEAHWAIEAKNPGDDADYRVLRCGAPAASVLESYLSENDPGTPHTEVEGRTTSLPWASIGCHHRDQTWLSLAVMSWSGDRDRDRRAIASTVITVVPWTRAGEVRYRLWADALGRAVLPADGEVLELELDTSAPPDDADVVDSWWAAGVAALLFDGRVVITGDDRASMVRRLAVVTRDVVSWRVG